VVHLARAAESHDLVGTGVLAVLATVDSARSTQPDPRKPRSVRHQKVMLGELLGWNQCPQRSHFRSSDALIERVSAGPA
jgi:hypothetical protein